MSILRIKGVIGLMQFWPKVSQMVLFTIVFITNLVVSEGCNVDKELKIGNDGKYVKSITAVMYKDQPVYRINGNFIQDIGKINVEINDKKAEILVRTDEYLLVSSPFDNLPCTTLQCLLDEVKIINIYFPDIDFHYQCKGNSCIKAEICPSVSSSTLAIDLSIAHPDLAEPKSKKMTMGADGFLYIYSQTAIYRLPAANATGSPFTNATVFAGNSSQPGFIDNTNPLVARFNVIQDIVADKTGNIYVADTSFNNGNDKIRKIDPQGNVTTFLSLPSGKFIRALATDEQNNIYMANYSLQIGSQVMEHLEVAKYNSSGGLLSIVFADDFPFTVGNIRIPVAMAVSGIGEIYMSCLTETLYPNRFRTILLRIKPATSSNAAQVDILRSEREGIVQVAVASNGYVFYADQNNAWVSVITQFAKPGGPWYTIGQRLDAPQSFQKDGVVCIPTAFPFHIGNINAITTRWVEGIVIAPDKSVYFNEYGGGGPAKYNIRKLVFDQSFW